MTLKEKFEMISNNDEATKEASALFEKIGSYVRTVEWVWNKYFG